MSRGDDSGIVELIGRVYDAALDERLWPDLAPKIATAFNSISTCLQVRDQRGGVQLLALSENLAPSLMDEYRAYYWQHDVWSSRAAELGMGQVFASKDLVSDAAFSRTEYYQDWLRKLGVFYVVGSVFPIAQGQVGAIGTHRERRRGTYEEEEKRPVAAFLPHLQRALQIRQRLAGLAIERSAALDALDRCATATLVVALEGRVLYANGPAESILRAGDGLRLVSGRLATTARATSERLMRAIRNAVDVAAGSDKTSAPAIAILREDRLPLTVLVAPLRPARDGFGAAVPAAIVFIRDPEHATISAFALQSLFGLTAAEASIAGALALGKSVTEIAAASSISPHTVRTHVKSIFLKTGTSRQAELVALLLRSIAPMVR